MNRRIYRILPLACIILLSANLLQAQEAAAARAVEEGAENPAIASFLQKSGKFLLETLTTWGINRGLDNKFPKKDDEQQRQIRDLKHQLDQMENDLKLQLAENQKSNLALGADVQAVATALRAAQTQSKAIARIDDPNATPADLGSIRQELLSSRTEAGTVLNFRPVARGQLQQNLNSLQSHLAMPKPSSESLLPPSFNCRKADSDVERFICSNALLADADGRMGKAYWSLYAQLDLYVSGSQALDLKQSQRRWIRDRDIQLRNDCTQGSQINEFCALNIWRARTSYLAQKQSLLGGTR